MFLHRCPHREPSPTLLIPASFLHDLLLWLPCLQCAPPPASVVTALSLLVSSPVFPFLFHPTFPCYVLWLLFNTRMPGVSFPLPGCTWSDAFMLGLLHLFSPALLSFSGSTSKDPLSVAPVGFLLETEDICFSLPYPYLLQGMAGPWLRMLAHSALTSL